MPADWTLPQGTLIPILEDTLTYSNGTIAEPESVEFVMRAITANEPVTLSGTAAVVSKVKGEVSYTPGTGDSDIPGNYLGQWLAKVNKKPMMFPTTGYAWVTVPENLSTKGGATLVGLPEVLDHLKVPANDRIHDNTLLEYIEAVRPLIENLTGPIIPERYDEWYEGGHVSISLRHKPSFGYGTTPIFNVMAVSEYRGPIEYNLSLVGTPTQGSVYSGMSNDELGIIVRRSAGGASTPFWRDPNHPQQSVHVVYQAGQERVPANVRRAALETVRWWYQTTEAVGRGGLTRSDDEQIRPMVALPYHCEAMLAPTRRHPALA
jgi:hypothetical protein